jgi:hypothetical protein
MAPEAAAEGGRGGGRSGGGNPQQAAWRREAESVKTEIDPPGGAESHLLHGARTGGGGAGQAARSALDAFQRDRIPLLDDLRAQVEDAAIVRAEAAWSAQLKRLAVDLRTKDSARLSWRICWINISWRWCHERNDASGGFWTAP